MQIRFYVLWIYTLLASEALRAPECEPYSTVTEVNGSLSVWDVNCGSLVFRHCFHLPVAQRGKGRRFLSCGPLGSETLPTPPFPCI